MRNEIYMDVINQGIQRILTFQDIRKGALTEGCFFYPYWRDKRERYVNSRWQEAVLSLSWYYNKFNNEEIWERLVKGIDFWCKLQHEDGSFPEYSRKDRSFSATAFSTLAIVNSLNLINYSKDKWLEKIRKSCNYLIHNDETILINQEMAASLALLKAGEYLHEPNYIKESEKKLEIVLRNQAEKGYYKEKSGFDLGYSSLTLELLGHYYLSTRDRKILDSAAKFINFFFNLDLKRIRNIRDTNWIIVGGFELFSEDVRTGKEALKKVLNNFNIQHLEYDSNFCTDLYRLCYACDNFKEDLEHLELKTEINTKGFYSSYHPSRVLNILRPFGLHKLRRIKSIFV